MQGFSGHAGACHDARLITVQQRVGLKERRLYILRVRQCRTLLLQFLLDTVGEVSALQLIILEAEEVLILPCRLQLLLHIRELPDVSLIKGESLGIVVLGVAVMGYDVHDTELEILFLKQQVLVLGVYIHQTAAQRAEEQQWCRTVIDEGPRLTVGGELAADDTLVFVIVGIVLVEQFLKLVTRDVELCLDDAFLLARLYGLGVSPVAKEQTDGTEDDALSRSGLTGDNGEAFREIDV